MQKIDGTTIKVNRGDSLNLTLSLKLADGTNYTFQNGDVIVFSIYKKGNMSGNAVLMKQINVTEEATSIEINLTNTDTQIGELINKPVQYWYEIELNNQYTVIGYDDNGAKVFELYPEGSKLA